MLVTRHKSLSSRHCTKNEGPGRPPGSVTIVHIALGPPVMPIWPARKESVRGPLIAVGPLGRRRLPAGPVWSTDGRRFEVRAPTRPGSHCPPLYISLRSRNASRDQVNGRKGKTEVAHLRTSGAGNVGAEKDSDKRQRQAIEAFADPTVPDRRRVL
jgi:hypothetical protein